MLLTKTTQSVYSGINATIQKLASWTVNELNHTATAVWHGYKDADNVSGANLTEKTITKTLWLNQEAKDRVKPEQGELTEEEYEAILENFDRYNIVLNEKQGQAYGEILNLLSDISESEFND